MGIRGAIVVAGLGILVSCGFWAYRGLEAYRRALGDYVPTPYDASEARRARLAEGLTLSRRVSWKLADGSAQNAFYLPARNGALIIYAHGSPGSGLDSLPEARALAESGYGALLVDLPGYGFSEGRRAWDTHFLESMRRAVDFAVTQPGIDPDRIGGHGYSNGGSLIARAAAADPRLRALVLVATYTNLTDQLHHAFRRRTPGMGYFAIAAGRRSGVPVAELDTLAALRQIGPRPTLIVAAGMDHSIPTEMADRLQSGSVRAEMLLFERMGHVGFAERMGAAYLDPLKTFWDDALAP